MWSHVFARKNQFNTKNTKSTKGTATWQKEQLHFRVLRNFRGFDYR